MGIRELRDNLTATIRRVRAGEVIEVTHDGTPVALIAPIPSDRITRLLLLGATAPKPLTRPIRRFPATSGLTSEEILEADRAER
jgi:prevent-host-death family protein